MVWEVKEQGLKNEYEKNTNGVLDPKDLPYILEIMRTELINRHHDDLLVSYFEIRKTRKLVTQKTIS